MSDSDFGVTSLRLETTTGPDQLIYSGMEGATTVFANYVETIDAQDHVLVRFFHQRPMRQKPIKMDLSAGETKAAAVQPDTLDNALQTSMSLSPSATIMLYNQLAFLIKQRIPAEYKPSTGEQTKDGSTD